MDIEKKGLILHDGLEVNIYGDQLEAEALVKYLTREGI